MLFALDFEMYLAEDKRISTAGCVTHKFLALLYELMTNN
jgi:hypothetical protein